MPAVELTDIANNLQPVGDRVLFRRDRKAETTEAGLIDTTAAKTVLNTGTIVAVSTEVTAYSPGDRVLIASAVGTTIKDSTTKEDYVLLSSRDIYGVLKG